MAFAQMGVGLIIGAMLIVQYFDWYHTVLLYVCSIVFSIYLTFLLLLNIVDAVLFVETNRRLDAVVLNNTNLYSMLSVLTIPQFLAILILFIFIMSFGYTVEYGIRFCLSSMYTKESTWPMPTVWLMVGGTFVFTALAMKKLSISEKQTQNFVVHQNEWVRDRFALFLKDELNLILMPVLSNFFTLFYRKKIEDKFQKYPLTIEEQSFLKTMGLEPQDSLACIPFTTRRYTRIILLSIESLGLQYISKYNPRLPIETTPFFNLLSKKFHTLENYYTSMLPTDLGLTATLASRLDNTWVQEETQHETILSVLSKEGFKTCVLRNVDIHYDNHHKKIPAIYKTERFIGGDSLEKEFPNAVKNNWGVCDAVVYQKALALLNEYRSKDQPVALLINTMDTHPRYWWNPITKFPKAIEKTQSRALRSLYQMDSDLSNFFQALMKQGLFDDDTLLLIFGDHSPCFGPEYQELTGLSGKPDKIPLVFVTRTENPFQHIARDRLSCQLDLLPTLCDGLGLPIPNSAIGNSLFETWVHRRISGRIESLLIETESEQIIVNMHETASDPKQLAVQKWLAHRMKY